MSKKRLIEQANEAYYEDDTPVLTDEEFDLLAESGLERAEGHTFRKKVKHTIPMGSLSKIKTFEDFKAWVHKYPDAKFIVTPKIDGNSIAVTYIDGHLKTAVTRGDGIHGNDCTDKVKASGNILHRLRKPVNLTVRCEAVIPKENQAYFEKNIRNVASGLLNSKEVSQGVNLLKFMVFDSALLDDEKIYQPTNWMLHQEEIQDHGFYWIKPYMLIGNAKTMYENVESWFKSWDTSFPYFIDGVVVEALDENGNHLEKEGKHPAHMIAVKFQRPPVRAIIDKVEWTLGMHNKLAPVLVLETPVTIDGTSVQRISASNYGIMCAAGLWPGAEVGVIKSGDIIPYIAEVYQRSVHENIVVCPECKRQAEIDDRRIDLICPYNDCQGKEIIKLQTVFRVLDIDGISDKTIENLYREGFQTLELIFKAFPYELARLEGWGEKSAEVFLNSLRGVSMTEAQIIAATGIKGIALKQAEKLMYAYGSLEDLVRDVRTMGGLKIIDGFGDILSKQVVDNMRIIMEMAIQVVLSGISIKVVIDMPLVPVCVTGPHPTMGRKEFSRFLEGHGYKMVSSVTKECKIVLTADTTSNSGKMKKAKAREDVEIMLYEDFEDWLLVNQVKDR